MADPIDSGRPGLTPFTSTLVLVALAGMAGCGGGDDGSAKPRSPRCSDGTPIDDAAICDGTVDCAGGEDEDAETCANRARSGGNGGTQGGSGASGSGASNGSGSGATGSGATGSGANGSGASSSSGGGSSQGCFGNSDCSSSERCNAGSCEALVEAGGFCAESADCAGGLACNSSACGPCAAECADEEFCDASGECLLRGAHTAISQSISATLTSANPGSWTYDLEYGIVAFDSLGNPLTGDEGNFFFSLHDFEINGFSIEFAIENAGIGLAETCTRETITLDDDAISVGLVMDQSGSISSTDPNDFRISAGSEFLRKLESRDESLLVSFASGNSCTGQDITLWNNGFTSQHSSLEQVLQNELLGCEGGSTPFFDATISTIGQVDASARNPAKAIVAFTDGEDTSSAQDEFDVIREANAAGSRVFTVGLSEGVNNGVLSRIAQRTDGAYFFASEISTLVTSFRALNHLIRGTYTVFHCTDSVTIRQTTSTQQLDWFSTSISIQLMEPGLTGGVYNMSAPMFVDI